MQQHRVARARERLKRRHHAAEHAVLVSDVLGAESRDAVAGLVPADDRLEVLIARLEVAEVGLAGALDQRLGHGGNHGEVHVGDPHGNGVKALVGPHGRGARCVGIGQSINGDSVLPAAVHDGREIVRHALPLPYLAAPDGVTTCDTNAIFASGQGKVNVCRKRGCRTPAAYRTPLPPLRPSPHARPLHPTRRPRSPGSARGSPGSSRAPSCGTAGARPP